MSDSESRSSILHLKQFIPTIALITLLVPALASADPYLLLQNDGSHSPAQETAVQSIKRPMTVGINENGDLMIRHKDLSLILAYNPPPTTIDHQERIRIAQRSDSPAISGISFKVSMVF